MGWRNNRGVSRIRGFNRLRRRHRETLGQNYVRAGLGCRDFILCLGHRCLSHLAAGSPARGLDILRRRHPIHLIAVLFGSGPDTIGGQTCHERAGRQRHLGHARQA